MRAAEDSVGWMRGWGALGRKEVSRSLCGLSFNFLVLEWGSSHALELVRSIFLGARSDMALLEDKVLGDHGSGRSNSLGTVINSWCPHPFPLGRAGGGWATWELASWACRSGKGCHGNSEGKKGSGCRDQDTQKHLLSGWPGPVGPTGQ